MDVEELIKKLREMKTLGGHPRFYEILLQMADLHSRKNQNYAQDGDPLSNLRECEKMGIPAHMGVAIRLTDKFSRYTQLLKGKQLITYSFLKKCSPGQVVYLICWDNSLRSR